ncbi:MAG: SDR family NAD(P)-dependent oxidoreductase [Candidatus Lokiarchaeota archaeon]|nr:SDR family NAD(P)-dependent oxidoreductase [Candidatus Lokiarchaeota archaeon]
MLKEKLIKKEPFDGKIVIVSGGSTGMGKATAKNIVQLGGSVCIIARNVENLKKAVKEIESLKTNDKQFVEMISCDTTKIEQLKPLLAEFIEKHRVPDYLFNFVGYALPDYIENYKLEDFQKQIDGNYYGQLIPTLIMLPYFMKDKKGYIAFVSSAVCYYPLIGYAAYAPAKYAILGLTEILRNELKPYNINVSILFPPDTDTPSFERENKTKPKETLIMSERSKIYSPEEIADAFVEGILKKKYTILPGVSKLAWRMFRHFPKLIHWITDRDLKKVRKKLGKE